MRLLFLDAEAWRHDGLDIMLLGTPHDIHHVYTTAEFSATLATKSPFDVVCFEYDLKSERTGFDAAKDFVASRHRPTRCIVHTWDFDGGQAIWHLLEGAGHDVWRLRYGTALRGLIAALEAA